VVSPEDRLFGRPENQQALNGACHFLELPPTPATRSESTSRWRGCADEVIEIETPLAAVHMSVSRQDLDRRQCRGPIAIV
jgi:hypothetical protein